MTITLQHTSAWTVSPAYLNILKWPEAPFVADLNTEGTLHMRASWSTDSMFDSRNPKLFVTTSDGVEKYDAAKHTIKAIYGGEDCSDLEFWKERYQLRQIVRGVLGREPNGQVYPAEFVNRPDSYDNWKFAIVENGGKYKSVRLQYNEALPENIICGYTDL